MEMCSCDVRVYGLVLLPTTIAGLQGTAIGRFRQSICLHFSFQAN